jgi:predicted O-methyltransferase YrrM
MTDDRLILALIDELDALRASRDDAWQIPRVEGDLLHQIALSTRAKTVVEIGTSYGFSGLFWSMALKRTGGHLHTIDRDPKKYESAKQTFHRAGVAEIVTNYLGDAAEILRNMPAGAGIDIAFIDADKPATQAYFDLLWPKMRTGGSVLVDNATTHRQDLWEFVHAVRNRADARSAEVAVGNGIEWIIKVA